MIHVKENNIEINYHFDGGSFDEKDVYPVNKDMDAQEIQSIKIRLGVLRRMRKLYPDDINLIEEYLSLSNRLSFLLNIKKNIMEKLLMKSGIVLVPNMLLENNMINYILILLCIIITS